MFGDPMLDADRYRDDESDTLPEQYRDMPSFGQRLGAKPVQPTPEAAQDKVQQTQNRDSPPPVIQMDPQKLPPGIVRSNATPAEIPSPAASSPFNTTLPGLVQERSKAAMPIDPKAVDPKTGKPMYRMPLWQRIVGGLADAANGFARTGVAPIYIGPGATNNRFERDKAMQQENLGRLDTDISNQEKLGEQQRKLHEDATKQAYEGQLGEARLQTAGATEDRAKTYGEVADTKSQLVESQRQLNEARANKANTPEEPKTEAEIAVAYQNALIKGDKAGAAKYKGAMDMLTAQKKAGRDTSAADLSKYLQVSEFKIRQHQQINDEAEKERAKRYAELDNDKSVAGMERRLDKTGNKTAAAKAQIDRDLEVKYRAQHNKVESDAEGMLGLTKTGQKLSPSKPPAKPTDAPPAGKAWAYEVATGKVGLVPASQAAALKKGHSKYATW